MLVTSKVGMPAVSARGLRKSFVLKRRALLCARKRRDCLDSCVVDVLRGVDFDARFGEMVAIVGPSGSGKSTLLHCLSGLESPTDGSVSIMGEPMEASKRAKAARIRARHIGFVFQQYNLVPSLNALENAALAARFAGVSDSAAAAKEALCRVGLADKEKNRPAELSGGEQQRVAIARALACSSDIVFADEPTGALDSKTAHDVLTLLRGMADGPRRAVVVVTHDLEAASCADRVIVMRDGKMTCELAAPAPSDILAAMEA